MINTSNNPVLRDIFNDYHKIMNRDSSTKSIPKEDTHESGDSQVLMRSANKENEQLSNSNFQGDKLTVKSLRIEKKGDDFSDRVLRSKEKKENKSSAPRKHDSKYSDSKSKQTSLSQLENLDVDLK